ncbi:hypothetical protein IH979_01910 [Patescibacteria group bacterium]|nr:hypothetical protein [Patescibacteria group bacterium]
MPQKEKKRSRILAGFLSFLSGILYILSLPAVRNFIWNQLVGKSREKVIDAKAKVVAEEEHKKRRLF